MSQPLSGPQFQAVGLFGGPRGRYGNYGTGPEFEAEALAQFNRDPEPNYSGAGFYWQDYPAMISGMAGTTTVSTTTGAPVNTPEESAFSKVGGGRSQAQIPDYGGTAAY